jgi:small subunit ribosomal protein S21
MGDKEHISDMLRVVLTEGAKIERALKIYKRKCNNTKQTQELRERQEFRKPSEIARKQRLRARYIQKLRNEEE